MELKEGKNIEQLFTGKVIPEEGFTFTNEEYVRMAVSQVWEGTVRELRYRIFRLIDEDVKTFIDNSRELVKSGFRKVEEMVDGNLHTLIQEVRSKQVERDPSNPRTTEFGNRLLNDIDEELGQFISEDLPGVSDVNEGEKFELRFYSGSDTVLDYTKGMDCWVELFDLGQNRSIDVFSIDITTNPNHDPTNADELILVSEEEDIDVNARGKIAPAFFKSSQYNRLKSKLLRSFKKNAEVQRVKRAIAAA